MPTDQPAGTNDLFKKHICVFVVNQNNTTDARK